MTPVIDCHGLVRRLPSGGRMLTVLAGIDLTVAAGEFVAVLGPSGSGKSTLLGLLAGLDRPSEGEVRIEGHALGEMDENALAVLRRDRLGFVFQAFELLGNLTALENVILPLELADRRDARERAAAMLAEVGLADRAHHYPSELSGGEQQRVALARAFAPAPAILLADEPTGNLDAETAAVVLELLAEMRARAGTTLVLVTHDPAVARLADRRLHLRAGKIEREEREPATPRAVQRS